MTFRACTSGGELLYRSAFFCYEQPLVLLIRWVFLGTIQVVNGRVLFCFWTYIYASFVVLRIFEQGTKYNQTCSFYGINAVLN